MPLLDASTDKSAKTAITILLEKKLLAEISAYCQWRHIKNVKEFAAKSMQYVLKNDKDWRKVWLQLNQGNTGESAGD